MKHSLDILVTVALEELPLRIHVPLLYIISKLWQLNFGCMSYLHWMYYLSFCNVY